MGSIWSMGLGAHEIALLIARGDLTGRVLLAALHKNRFVRPRERKVVVADPSTASPRTTTEGGLNGHSVGPVLFLGGVALPNLRYDHCRWPIGDPLSPDFYFCGEQKGDKSRYCNRHHAIAYRPVEPIELEE